MSTGEDAQFSKIDFDDVADVGDAEAMCRDDISYRNGHGVAKDEAKGVW
jgi:hypothetical protein